MEQLKDYTIYFDNGETLKLKSTGFISAIMDIPDRFCDFSIKNILCDTNGE